MNDNKCPVCGCLFLPVDGITYEAHLSKSLLAIYSEMQENYIGEVP